MWKTSGNVILGYLGEWFFNIFPSLYSHGSAPWYLLEFLWIMLQNSVQALCNIKDGAFCDNKWEIAGNCCWLLLQKASF